MEYPPDDFESQFSDNPGLVEKDGLEALVTEGEWCQKKTGRELQASGSKGRGTPRGRNPKNRLRDENKTRISRLQHKGNIWEHRCREQRQAPCARAGWTEHESDVPKAQSTAEKGQCHQTTTTTNRGGLL